MEERTNTEETVPVMAAAEALGTTHLRILMLIAAPPRVRAARAASRASRVLGPVTGAGPVGTKRRAGRIGRRGRPVKPLAAAGRHPKPCLNRINLRGPLELQHHALVRSERERSTRQQRGTGVRRGKESPCGLRELQGNGAFSEV